MRRTDTMGKRLDIRLPDQYHEILEQYCSRSGAIKTGAIKNSQDKREITRTVAVKMLLNGYKHKEIMPMLNVSSGFISTWKKALF